MSSVEIVTADNVFNHCFQLLLLYTSEQHKHGCCTSLCLNNLSLEWSSLLQRAFMWDFENALPGMINMFNLFDCWLLVTLFRSVIVHKDVRAFQTFVMSGLYMCFQRELVLYPDKNGSVADLLTEARKQVELADKGACKLRWVLCCSFFYCLCCAALARFAELRLCSPAVSLDLLTHPYLPILVRKLAGSMVAHPYFSKYGHRVSWNYRNRNMNNGSLLPLKPIVAHWHLYISSHFRDWSIRPVLIGQKRLLNQWTSTLHWKFTEVSHLPMWRVWSCRW